MPDSFHKQLARAKALIEIARYREAIVELSALAASDQGRYTVMCLLALCHYGLGEGRMALKFAKEGVAIDPHGEWAFRLMSLSYSRLGMNKEALKAAEDSVRIAPELPYALLTLANAQAAYGHLDDAAETCALLLQIEPDANAHTTMGLIDLERGRLAQAQQSLQKALKLDPQFAAAHTNLGMIYQASDRDKAREAFLAALKIDPTLATARHNLRRLENLEKNQPIPDEEVISRFNRLHFYLLGVILFARVTNSFLPEVVNLFLPSYRPKSFHGALNAVFAISIIVWVTSICRRGDRVFRFAKLLKTGIALYLIFHWLVQLSVATFYLMVDADVNPYIGIAFMVVIAVEWLVLWLRMRVEARVED